MRVIEAKLNEPLRVKTPQLIFDHAMSDICHPEVQQSWIEQIIEVITGTPRHFDLLLTKRANLIG